MSQCVPSWDYIDISHSNHVDLTKLNSSLLDVSMLDYEVAELTWENGQLALHGLGQPCEPVIQNFPTTKYTWDKPSGGGTLESIVNQAITSHVPLINNVSSNKKKNSHDGGGGVRDVEDLVRSFEHHRATAKAGGNGGGDVGGIFSTFDPMNALVPNSLEINNDRVTIERGSCHVANDTTSKSAGAGLTLSSFDSPENTFSCELNSKTTNIVDDYGLNSLSRPQQQRKIGNDDKEKKGTNIRSSISTKASRVAAVHNQSERKRRDKINQRMKTLQKMVPISNKSDKASMLDEVIEYLKQLQSQINMVNRMSNMSSMMLPSLAMQQHHLQISMMNPLGMGMGNHVMDINTMMAPMHNLAVIPSVIPPTAFLPLTPWGGSSGDPLSAFAACQSQPMTMDAYSKMAALYQQSSKPLSSSTKN